MRNSAILLSCAALMVCACSHENVHKDYVGTASMTQDQVSDLLAQRGYTDISDLHKNGDDWVDSGSKDGDVVTFDIDKKGTVHAK